MPKGIDPLTLPGRDAAFRARSLRHRHNSFLGFVAHAKANMYTIMDAETTTPAAIAQAKKIIIELAFLGQLLATRLDPKDLQP